MAPFNFARSSQISNYIVANKLGYKYPNISGDLEMEKEGRTWKFPGGIAPSVYRDLCAVLSLANNESKAKVIGYTPEKDIIRSKEEKMGRKTDN